MFQVVLCSITIILQLCSGYELRYCKGLLRSEPILVQNAAQKMNLFSLSSIMRSYAHKFGGKTALDCLSSESSTNLLVIQEELTAMRKRVSVDIKKPAFVVFTNKARDAIVSEMPQSIEQIDKLTYGGNKILRTVYPDILSITSRFILGDYREIEEPSVLDNLSKVQPSEKIPEETAAQSVMSSTELDEPVSADSTEISKSSLSPEQRKAAERTLSGQNVFITGSAGTGKSYLLKFIVQESKKKYPPDSIAVTAPTGISAINVGGVTINSFAGYGLGNDAIPVLRDKVLKQRNAVQRWKNLKVLIIDEVSMLRPEHFQLLDEIARKVKKNKNPFGGIQLILSGDFMQLSPIPEKGLKIEEETIKYCFQSPQWRDAGLLKSHGGTIQLEEVLRQKDDSAFVDILNEVRKGQISQKSLTKLNQCVVGTKAKPTAGVVPTKIFCYNKDVDRENSKKLAELPGNVVSATAIDIWTIRAKSTAAERTIIDSMDKVAPPSIDLKIGAQVMLLRNQNKGDESATRLVNGSRGVITGMKGHIPTVMFDTGETISVKPVEYEYIDPLGSRLFVRKQIPLKLAWALSVHKCQGTTISSVELKIDNAFDYGQAYVGLSRVTTIDGLWLTTALTPRSIKADPLALEYYNYSSFDDLNDST